MASFGNSRFHMLAKPLLICLPLLLASAANATEGREPDLASSWTVTERMDSGSVRLSSSDIQGTLHAVCDQAGCAMFVEPLAGCTPGQPYPLLMNSARKVAVLPSHCVVIREDEGLRLVARVAASDDLVAALLSNTDISIAFPTQAGSMAVLNIRMAGAGQLLAQELRLRGESAGERDGSGADGLAKREPKSGPTMASVTPEPKADTGRNEIRRIVQSTKTRDHI